MFFYKEEWEMEFLPYFLGGCALAILAGSIILWILLVQLVYLTAELPIEQRRVMFEIAKRVALCYIKHREKKKGEDLRHFKEALR